ncbi:MAG TPA: SagB family peptide dehydrogenase [Mycobacteriales bacterium]|nr:SagB family peptide dehydrogenase [Mycobacteriales bacterium]
MSTVTDYADAVMRRSRVPMEPADFVPDWRDRPRKAKFFPGADLVPLPPCPYPAAASVDSGLTARPGSERFTLPLLSGLLQDSYGLVGRRLGVQANSDLSALPHYVEANWSRGAASGGGLYPVSVYWAAGPSGPLLPGLYHYAPARHGLERLLAGDVSAEVREAVGGADTDQFLILGVQFWQNSFKYNSFSYHVVTMDTGALLQAWRMWAGARGLAIEPRFWFDEPRLTRLLGVAGDREGVFAVVPLRWAGTPSLSAGAPARVRRSDAGRSTRFAEFGTVRSVHEATVDGGPRPGTDALAAAVPGPAAAGGHPLPPTAPMGTDVRTALRARRSSFGRFSGLVPTTRPQLAALLAATAAGAALPTDLGTTELAAIYVFVNHVEGLDPGSYRYDPGTRTLSPVTAGPPGEFLQRNYFLANYNLEQAGAVIVPAVRTGAVVAATGDRGYRLVTAVIGAAAQAVYTAAAALGIACGVALGFDSVSYVEELGLEGTGEVPLLLMMVGHETGRPADFRYELAR